SIPLWHREPHRTVSAKEQTPSALEVIALYSLARYRLVIDSQPQSAASFALWPPQAVAHLSATQPILTGSMDLVHCSKRPCQSIQLPRSDHSTALAVGLLSYEARRGRSQTQVPGAPPPGLASVEP